MNDRATTIRRFPTGLASLDELLGGGLPAFATVILAGEPGTGKTILTQQMLFANAAAGRKGLYLTTLSESPMKAARFQSEFAFFDPDRFGELVVYMDIGETIRRHSLSKAVEVIASSLREHQPDMVVVDSFKAIHDISPSSREMRIFVYDLAIELSAIQATTILVGEYEALHLGDSPEFAVADGILWMSLERTNSGSRRFLRILKMRGVDHPTEPFNFGISRRGVELFALPPVKPEDQSIQRETQVPTGIPGLDDLVRGGLPATSTLLVSGEAGTGKSTVSMQYLLHGARDRGDKGLYLSYEEPPAQLIANAARFGWDLAGLIDEGMVWLSHTPLLLVNPDEQTLHIQRMLAETGARRAVLDSLTMLVHGIDSPEVVRRHVYQLSNVFKDAGCTALVTTDPPAGSGLISRFGVEESIIDGVLLLRTVLEQRERKRYVEVYKLRGVGHVTGTNLMRIGAEGVRVYPRTEEVRG